MINKIIKVIKPPKNDRWRGGLYHVYFEHSPDQAVAVNKAEYEMIKFEGDLILKGIDSKDILKYKELVEAYCEDEHSLEGEGY